MALPFLAGVIIGAVAVSAYTNRDKIKQYAQDKYDEFELDYLKENIKEKAGDFSKKFLKLIEQDDEQIQAKSVQKTPRQTTKKTTRKTTQSKA